MEHISKHLEIPKKELQKHEPKPLNVGKDFQVARKSALIKDTHEADISVVLKYIMLKVGMRAQNLPSKEEKEIIVSHIYQHYPGNTIGEIRLAFDMAITGSLNLKQDDVKCYENFSCAYFSSIMNAYLEWAKEEFKQTQKEDPPPIVILSDEELDNLHRSWTEEFYQQIKSGIVKEIPDYTRAILTKDKLIENGGEAEMFFTYKLGNGILNIYKKE